MMRFVPLGLLALLTACGPDVVVGEGPPECWPYCSDDEDSDPDPADPVDNDGDGWTVEDGDCDDTDVAINPGATEVCDGIDNDCSGESDDVVDNVWYLDGDEDGYGGTISLIDGCEIDSTSAWVGSSDDCDDDNAEVNPVGTETCNGVDDDCDGTIDPDTSSDAATWYLDADNDGYGELSSSDVACEAPEGYVAYNTDCDDTASDVYPGATEVCDGADNDCDGDTDEAEGNPDAIEQYPDTDSDGYGYDEFGSTLQCPQDGWVETGGDCDDGDEYINPDMLEVCADTVDNDCDGDADSSPCITEGDYEGDFVIILTETTYGLGSDSCEGSVWLTVDTTADPMISGTVECEFVGSFGTYITGTQTMDVEGDFDADLVPSGTIDSSSFGWGFDWDDDGSSDDTVDGSFDGSDSYSVGSLSTTFDYEGSFQSTYTP